MNLSVPLTTVNALKSCLHNLIFTLNLHSPRIVTMYGRIATQGSRMTIYRASLLTKLPRIVTMYGRIATHGSRKATYRARLLTKLPRMVTLFGGIVNHVSRMAT